MAQKMPMSVKMDMSHEAPCASSPNNPMSAVMIVGTLYWMSATEMPAAKSTMPTNTWF